MADKQTHELPIGELPPMTSVTPETLIPAEQNGVAMHLTGEQFAGFAREAAAADVQRAVDAANAAETANSGAQQAASTAGGYSSAAGNSAAEAQQDARDAAAARQAIENMGVTAETLSSGSQATVSKSVAPDGTVTLHYGIPKGDTGAQGATGPTGGQGVQGPPGPRGIDGVAVATDTTYAFTVNAEGHLILHYAGTVAPDFEINAAGHLLLHLD